MSLTGISRGVGSGGGANQKNSPWGEYGYFLEQHILPRKSFWFTGSVHDLPECKLLKDTKGCLLVVSFSPLSPNSDRHQISPCDINAQLSAQVSRMKEMVTRDELFWYLNNFSQLALQQMYGNQ